MRQTELIGIFVEELKEEVVVGKLVEITD